MNLLARDLRAAARHRIGWLLPLAFFVAAVSLFPLGLGAEPALLRRVAPGVVWACVLLAMLLALHAMFSADLADGSLEQMLLGQRSLTVLVAERVLGQWLLGGAPLVLLAPLAGVAFGLPGPAPLVLLASLLLAVLRLLTKRLRKAEEVGRTRDPVWVYVALFFATVYGGYFGGALGVILVGVLGLALHRLKLANALKSALSAVTATVTLVIFGIFGPVHWLVVAVAAPASLVGGFLGARVATRIPATPLRVLIVAFGVAVSIYLFLRG